MADSDPISEPTPNKRRKVDHELHHGTAWDSQDDSADEFTAEDFETQPTVPVVHQKRKQQLSYPPEQFRADLSSITARQSSPPNPFVTQPTQPLPLKTTPPSTDVLVDRSSPALPQISSSPKPHPAPIQRALFAKPRGGLLAHSFGPLGTTFRQPLGVQPKPQVLDLSHDSDDELDPPVHHSDDEETQGLRSNIKPTNFKKGGRGLDSTPNRSDHVIRESPHASSDGIAPVASKKTLFGSLMDSFGHNGTTHHRPADDSVSAYGGTSRPARLQQQAKQTPPARPRPVTNAVLYETLEDVPDYTLRAKIENMQTLCSESVQRCYDALMKAKGNEDAALAWLMDDGERVVPPSDETDELTALSPVVPRGVAQPLSQRPTTQSSQPVRSAAKQDIKAPAKTIAEKYARKPSQPSLKALHDEDEEDDEVQPRRRLVSRRRRTRSPSPPSSPPPPPKQRLPKPKTIAIESDEEASDSGIAGGDNEDIESADVAFNRRLLRFLNDCSVQSLAELCALPEGHVKLVLNHRPFASLDAVRTISNVAETTKSGKKSKSRPIGDRVVEIASEMWYGYDAVDELVEQCEQIAQPIQQALKGWGVGGEGGELQLMTLDEAHDSGIGTPASSCPSDDTPALPALKRGKGHFLGQPENMGDVTLKDFQLVGLNWLNLLWSKRLSCILADDMGLGKTCQVIAFFAHLQLQKNDGVHLVIVPGSTLENWMREFARFAPGLHVRPYYGSQAERPILRAEMDADFAIIDVIVTTYDIAVKPDDNKFLRKLRPAVCVYDEAHMLRNPQAQRYSQLMRIPADFRVLLTGTPLQNNLQELVAVLAFIMPELFQEKREQLDFIFKHKASTKDADHAALLSAERIARARTMMTPFILRRKKHQVLDLPTKHNLVEWCDMTPIQAKYYRELLMEAEQLLSGKTNRSRAQSAKATSNIIMALRKAAIHPLLSRRMYDDKKLEKIQSELLKHPEFRDNRPDQIWAYLTGENGGAGGQSLSGGDFGLHRFCCARNRPYLHKFALKKSEWMDSGKVQKFKELVSRFAKSGDRVLVFSQFTTMMDVLEAVLETLDIKFTRLDGSTKMETRQELIDLFATDTSISVFMLSTKAGGAGINLACANKVVIFDSGFNPQDDVQAENRAHRVGQEREVEVVRLVTRGTIEEQIHTLGESKLALDERVSGEASTAAEDKQAEKKGEQLVHDMFAETLQRKEMQQSGAGEGEAADLKDAFKTGLAGAGVDVRSKQAQY